MLAIFTTMHIIWIWKSQEWGLQKALDKFWSERNIFQNIVKDWYREKKWKVPKKIQDMITNFYL